MPAFLAKTRGTVVRLYSASAEFRGTPFAIQLRGGGATDGGPITMLGGNRADSRILITQVTRSEAGNFQLQHTFGNTVYAYIFGDRIGELKLSGLCFAGSCDRDTSGITNLYNTYLQNKISAASEPIIITFGSHEGLIGLLTGLSMDMPEPEMQLMQWSFRFNTFRGNS